MIDRLFSPAFGNRPQIFVGRRDTINDVMSGLKEMPGSKERAVLLLGQRGYGKTVLLLELADEASQAGYVVASPTVVSTGMLNRILEKLSVAAEPYLPRTKKQLTGGNNQSVQHSHPLHGRQNYQQQFLYIWFTRTALRLPFMTL